MAPVIRGNSLYTVVDGPTWTKAEANSVKLGGHLVTINDAGENRWIHDAYNLNPFWDRSGDVELFGGLYRESVSSPWKWASGDPVSFTKWSSSEPSNGPAELYLGLGWSDHYSWNDTYLQPIPESGRTASSFPYYSLDMYRGIAEIPLTSSITFSSTPKEGTGIFATSINLSAGTTSSGNLAEGAPVWWKVTGITADDLASGDLTGTGTIANGKLDIQHSLKIDTDAGERFEVSVFSDSDRTQQIGTTIIGGILEAPVIRGNSIYTIVDGPSWTQAEANSVKLGGHLVTINDGNENTFLVSTYTDNHLLQRPTVSAIDRRAWFGLLPGTQAEWKWSDGSAVSYTNWISPQVESNGVIPAPTNGLKIGQTFNLNVSYATDANGRWENGTPSPTESLKGIAETPFIRRGDSAYVIVQGPTWEEAEANAVKLGGHLVTINDAAENQWISDTFRDRLAAPDKNWNNGLRSVAYIGLNDKESDGNPRWADGTPLGYTNFLRDIHIKGTTGRQDGWITSMLDPSGLTQSYAGLNSWLEDGITNVDPTGTYKGIAEIKLAPNNQPTGTPTLSGTLKAGQVITIDKTTIQDADNFTGYTPDFKYSWEISSNGTTWTPLTTTDATDNNTTYTLTTAEVGKQVRGVVSYLDGYGTQESVNSAASAPITSSAPPVQSLTLIAPSKSAIRSGTNSTSAISYAVSTGEKNLTGVGASLYFDSTQLTVSTAGEPFQKGLIGNAIVPDTNNADGDPKTDKVLALTYADFGGNFPGSGTTLPLTLANLNLVPTSSYSGTTLHLKGSPATGFTASGADLTLGYNASPVVNSTLPALTTNRGSAFTYTFRSDLFTDPDSTLTLSATTATGTALPSWLSFNPATRTLSGTPTTGGTVNLNLSASDELGSVSTPLSIKVREVQQLSSSASTIRYQRNKDFTLPINYSTTDGSSSTGLAFKVHFNSSLFSFDPNNGVSNKLASAGLFEVGAVQQDTGNSDNDPTTDQYIPISIASFTGQLPSGSKLADLTFRTADKAIDPLTGLRDTSINFSETSVASGYGFSGTSASLKPLSFNLDVDGDGLVTPLGDGLMVIRYLFGNAFAGDALINKAISPDSPLLGGKSYPFMTPMEKAGVASQIATNIQQGIDSGLLDVDKDGKTTPLGDGLMVIRRLFGNAFAGSALTSKAISPESPYFSDPNAHLIVASNIDALKPTPTVI